MAVFQYSVVLATLASSGGSPTWSPTVLGFVGSHHLTSERPSPRLSFQGSWVRVDAGEGKASANFVAKVRTAKGRTDLT